MNSTWVDDLTGLIPRDRIRPAEPMSRHTTFHIGGPADVFVAPKCLDELQKVIRFAARKGLPILVIGRGSNLLVRDGGIRGLVVQIADGLDQAVFSGSEAEAEAGISLSALAKKASAAGLAGLEFAAGIPGSLGGALAMNAGAYGGEMKDVVTWVDVLSPSGDLERVDNQAMDFSYRHSVLQRTGGLAVRAGLSLTPGRRDEIEARIRELNEQRQAKQPLSLPSAGSVFKRPPGHYAGPLIESCGLKGSRVGGAEVSTLHANFIVNVGGATASDVLTLIERVRRTVHENSGVWLEPEVRVVGEDPPSGGQSGV